MANGLLGDIKSRFGFGANKNDEYDEEYDEYDEEYDEYDDDYDDNDPYMNRNPITTRENRSDSGVPRLVSMDDARDSVRSSSYGSSNRSSRSSSVRSYGRTMVDSSLPPTMTAEGTAAVSAASNRRQAEGLNSLFGSTSDSSGRSGSSFGSAGSSSRHSGTFSSDLMRNSMQLSIPGQRQLQIIKPAKYDDAESVTKVLKAGDVAIIAFEATPQDLMKRILDFSFGAASALDASVECVGKGVFAIARSVPLDDNERADLQKMGIV